MSLFRSTRFAIALSAYAAMSACVVPAYAVERQKIAQANDAAKPAVEPPKPVSGVPESTSETYGDWVLICGQSPGGRVCEVDTTLSVRGQNTAVAKIAIARPAKDKPFRAVVVTPVNVQIAPGVKLEAEGSKAATMLPYRSCTQGGCFADSEVGNEQLQAFRRATAGQITLTDSGGRALALPMSFRGLDQAMDALAKK